MMQTQRGHTQLNKREQLIYWDSHKESEIQQFCNKFMRVLPAMIIALAIGLFGLSLRYIIFPFSGFKPMSELLLVFVIAGFLIFLNSIRRMI